MFTLHCPYCGQKRNVRKTTLGTTVVCKGCLCDIDLPEVETQEDLDRELAREGPRAKKAERDYQAGAKGAKGAKGTLSVSRLAYCI